MFFVQKPRFFQKTFDSGNYTFDTGLSTITSGDQIVRFGLRTSSANTYAAANLCADSNPNIECISIDYKLTDGTGEYSITCGGSPTFDNIMPATNTVTTSVTPPSN